MDYSGYLVFMDYDPQESQGWTQEIPWVHCFLGTPFLVPWQESYGIFFDKVNSRRKKNTDQITNVESIP